MPNRSSLIRSASLMPKGSPERRRLLAALKREAGALQVSDVWAWVDKRTVTFWCRFGFAPGYNNHTTTVIKAIQDGSKKLQAAVREALALGTPQAGELGNSTSLGHLVDADTDQIVVYTQFFKERDDYTPRDMTDLRLDLTDLGYKPGKLRFN